MVESHDKDGAVAGGDDVSRSSRLEHLVGELVSTVPEIEAASVVSFDGLPMASALPARLNEDRVAAMSAALLSLGERAAEGLGRGELQQVFIEAKNGTVFLVSADGEAVLVAVAARGAKVGMMLYEVRRTAAAVGQVLREDPEPFPAPARAAAPVGEQAAAPVVPLQQAAPRSAAPVTAPSWQYSDPSAPSDPSWS